MDDLPLHHLLVFFCS